MALHICFLRFLPVRLPNGISIGSAVLQCGLCQNGERTRRPNKVRPDGGETICPNPFRPLSCGHMVMSLSLVPATELLFNRD